jgi:hypothetical protein
MITLNVFFVHNTAMREREQTLSQFRSVLARHDPDKSTFKIGKVSHIESFDPNTIDMSVIQKTVNYAPFPEDHPCAKYNNVLKNLHIFQLSNVLKHMKAIEVAAQCGDNELCLILEDDISYDATKVLKSIETVIAMYQQESIVFLGLPNNKPDVKDTILEPTSELFEVIPYNDSYLIDRYAAKKLFDTYLPIKFINNIQMTIAIQTSGIKSYQAIPNVFVDGSKLGIFTSSLNVNNILMFNGDYMKIRSIATKDGEDGASKEDGELVKSLCDKSPCAPHPDFQYMKALYLCKTGSYQESLNIFKAAHEVYTKNMCIMNHESSFLKDYMKVYKYIQ